MIELSASGRGLAAALTLLPALLALLGENFLDWPSLSAFRHAEEKRIKKWYRAWKLELIERSNPEWSDLAESFGFEPLD